jgi:sugar phosphate isomerase/epimerase
MNTNNRRDFMKGSLMATAGIAASALTGTSVTASAAEGKTVPTSTRLKIRNDKKVGGPPMRLSVLSYSFRGLKDEGKMDVFGYLETCKYRFNLSIADIWNGFLTSMEESYLKKVRAALDEREMELADLCADGVHLWDDNATTRQKNYEYALANLNAAKILGAQFMRLDAGGNGTTWTNEQFDHIVKRYKEYAQFAYDNGFMIGAESHWGPETVWPNMKKLYKAVDHPAFGISCHIGGWHGTQAEKDQADLEAAPWICHTHFAWNIVDGPLEEKMKNLRDAGYHGSYSAEFHAGRHEYAHVAIQLAKMRAVFDNWRTEDAKSL